MAESKKAKKAKKENTEEFWKIMAPGWTQPVLRPKSATSERTLKSIKSKKGYIVESA